jgi:uncharacterized membrane protein YedE/YeeE
MKTHRIIALGALFGFILSRVAATDYDAINGMFLLTDLHLVGVIGVAIAVAAIGFALARQRVARSRAGVPLAMVKKPMKPHLILGGLMFGAGWAISGTCPGTAIAQLGEGTLAGGITIIGIVAGAYLHAALKNAGLRV